MLVGSPPAPSERSCRAVRTAWNPAHSPWKYLDHRLAGHSAPSPDLAARMSRAPLKRVNRRGAGVRSPALEVLSGLLFRFRRQNLELGSSRRLSK